MIKGVNAVIDWLEAHRAGYWAISSGPKEVIKAKDLSTGNEENYTFEQTLSHLQKSLNQLENGKYYITFWSDPNNRNNRLGEYFLIENSNVAVSGIQQPQFSNEDIETKIQKAVIAEREKWETTEKIKALDKEIAEHKAEKAALQKELKEAKAEVESTTNRVLNKLEPYIGGIVSAFLPKATPAIAGGGGQKIEFQEKDDLTERLENALNLWAETETMEDVIILIEKIASMTKNNQGTYNMAKSMLLNQ